MKLIHVSVFLAVAIAAAAAEEFDLLDSNYERELEACTKYRQKCRMRSRRCRKRCGRPCLKPRSRRWCKKLSRCMCGRNAGGKWDEIAMAFCEKGGGDVSVTDLC